METEFTEAYQRMSDEGNETECERVANILDLIIDGEANSEQQFFFSSHIEECAPCFESHQKQKLLKNIVSGHLKRVLVPERLANSIKAKIQETV